jgi:hypothetical protein
MTFSSRRQALKASPDTPSGQRRHAVWCLQLPVAPLSHPTDCPGPSEGSRVLWTIGGSTATAAAHAVAAVRARSPARRAARRHDRHACRGRVIPDLDRWTRAPAPWSRSERRDACADLSTQGAMNWHALESAGDSLSPRRGLHGSIGALAFFPGSRRSGDPPAHARLGRRPSALTRSLPPSASPGRSESPRDQSSSSAA